MRIGNRLDEYVLVDKLGEGGFGEVWLAEDSGHPGCLVAVKVSTRQDAAAALDREGRMQRSLQHPSIVRTLSARLDHDPPYLVNEWVPGESLRARLLRTRRLWPLEAVRVLGQVLEALAAAHAAGLVHRDVKPENVLLGPGGAVKLADFGLGRDGSGTAASIALSRGRACPAREGPSGPSSTCPPSSSTGGPSTPGATSTPAASCSTRC